MLVRVGEALALAIADPALGVIAERLRTSHFTEPVDDAPMLELDLGVGAAAHRAAEGMTSAISQSDRINMYPVV